MRGARIRGHPIHPVIAVFPLSLLASSVGLDLYALVMARVDYAEAATWALAAGLVCGVVVAIPGIMDWSSIPGAAAARRIAALHGLLNVAMMALMLAAWWLRHDSPASAPSAFARTLSLAALAAAAAAWWLGYRLGVPRAADDRS